MAWRKVTDAEWTYLVHRFFALGGGRSDERGRVIDRSTNELRRLFDEGLPGSPVSESERIRARTIVRERIRDTAPASTAFPDPYFELEWERAVQEKPDLMERPTHNRTILWEAFYAREVDNRQEFRDEWRNLIGRHDRPDEFDYGDT